VAWIWFFLLLISLGANLAFAAVLFASPNGAVVKSAADWLIAALRKFRGAGVLLLVALSLAMAGCEELESTPQVRALKKPFGPEVPVCNLPAPLRQRNWPSTNRQTYGQGSCVFASLINHVRWHNEFELAEWIRKNPEWQGGEYASRLLNKLSEAGIKYKANIHADPRFLDWCTYNRRGCILWWKPSHCCTFLGFSVDPRDGVEYAYVLDNNYPDRIERHEREQFIRLWAGYGGFGCTITSTEPASSLPWKSYEVVE
jgi:hypothetical protein